jgi:hypothetical protein
MGETFSDSLDWDRNYILLDSGIRPKCRIQSGQAAKSERRPSPIIDAHCDDHG